MTSTTQMSFDEALACIEERYGDCPEILQVCRNLRPKVESEVSPAILLRLAREDLQSADRKNAMATSAHEFTSD